MCRVDATWMILVRVVANEVQCVGIVDGGWGTDERGEGVRLCITLSFMIGGDVLRARESDNEILFIKPVGEKEILVRMYQEHGTDSVYRCA